MYCKLYNIVSWNSVDITNMNGEELNKIEARDVDNNVYTIVLHKHNEKLYKQFRSMIDSIEENKEEFYTDEVLFHHNSMEKICEK